MQQQLIRLYPHILPCVLPVLAEEFAEYPRAYALWNEFFQYETYDRDFTTRLLRVARGELGDTWELRRVATLMLQHQILQLPVTERAEYAFFLTQLQLLTRQGHLLAVSDAVLTEGYTTTTLDGFVLELRRKLERFAHAHQQLMGQHTSPEGIGNCLHLARQDCKLAFARYLFTPHEVVERILAHVKVSQGLPAPFRFIHVDDEVERVWSSLPEYEATIFRKLCKDARVYWVSETTSARLNGLVEYPLTTVVLVVKPPGSSLELELKRAGCRGDHLVSVVYERNGREVPPSHRFDGGSMGSSLQWEAGHTGVLANVHRLVHGATPPVSQVLSITSQLHIPVEDGEAHVLDYFTDPHVFGDRFHEMRAAMSSAVEAFGKERGTNLPDLPGALGVTVHFLNQVAPGQAIIAGTSTFRLDVVAKYLADEGPSLYFSKGLQVAYTKHDTRRFADEILEEVLGVYTPPEVCYQDHAQYVTAALSVPANRAGADQTYCSLQQQIGAFWGTLLAMRGHSWGESFVPRNVGLRSVWQDGEWKVKLIFMDHDNMQLIPRHMEVFLPHRILPGMIEDEIYIRGKARRGYPIVSTVESLALIYQVEKPVRQHGRRMFNQALEHAYRKTHEEILHNPRLQRFFSATFVERLRDWDTIVAAYLPICRDAESVEKWQREARVFLAKKGYEQRLIDVYLATVEKYAPFHKRLDFLYGSEPARVNERKAVA